MGWTYNTGRKGGRRRNLGVESLETRQLLSNVPTLTKAATVLSAPLPAGYSGGSTTGTDYQTITGATTTRSTYGVDGTGSSVAVIDTGVNYNNPDLGSGFGPGHKVVAGFDFSDNSPDPMASWQHGTAVAGLIAGSDPAHLGIAPGADIVALRVFNNNNQGDFNQVANALQWVIDNHSKYNITVVNISLSDGNNYTLNWFANDGGVGQRITSLIHQLDQINIPVVSATGNSFTGQQGQGFTSIVSDTISVTASTPTDQLASNAQRLGKAAGGVNATDIAAPGTGLVAPGAGSSYSSGDGTSFAAPIVSGAIVLLQQIYQARFGTLPTVDQIDGWLEQGATNLHDSVTGIDIGRLNIAGAAALIPGAPAATPTPANNTPPPPPPIAPPVPAQATQSQSTTSTTDVITSLQPTFNVFFNGAQVSQDSVQLSNTLQTVLNNQVKSVQIWMAKLAPVTPPQTVVSTPSTPSTPSTTTTPSVPTTTPTNPFAKLGMTNLTRLSSWKATTVSSAHPTGRLHPLRGSLHHRRHGR